MLGSYQAWLLRSPGSCTERSRLDPASDRPPLRHRKKLTASTKRPCPARCVPGEPESVYLRPNPAGSATVAPDQTLPAKEHDGQSPQLRVGALGVPGGLSQRAPNRDRY